MKKFLDRYLFSRLGLQMLFSVVAIALFAVLGTLIRNWATDHSASDIYSQVFWGFRQITDGGSMAGTLDGLDEVATESKRVFAAPFDEIDGLVQNRENATASWQVSQVNELLQQMENFDGVMIAATNFCKNLDPAIMRRFTFKLEFDYLDDEGKRAFFERMFKTKLTEAECDALKALRNLAPGDFRTVRQERFYLAGKTTNMDCIEALGEECALKKDGGIAPIGFAA